MARLSEPTEVDAAAKALSTLASDLPRMGS
jgi:hypothetical protein